MTRNSQHRPRDSLEGTDTADLSEYSQELVSSLSLNTRFHTLDDRVGLVASDLVSVFVGDGLKSI